MTVLNEVRARTVTSFVTRAVLLVALVVAALWAATNAAISAVAIASQAASNEIVTTLLASTPVASVRSGGPLTSAVYDSASVMVTGAPAGVQVIAASLPVRQW